MKRFTREIGLLIIIACLIAFLIHGLSRDSETAKISPFSKPTSNSAAMKNSTAASDHTHQMQSAQFKQVATEFAAGDGSTEMDGGENIRTDITIRVTGLQSKPGNLLVAVFESSEGFPKPDQSTSTTVVESDGDQAEFSLTLPVNHSLAIAVFQDLDGNKVITRNAFGIPTEPYGFSNKARGVLGPPTFEQAVVRVAAGQDSLEIQIR